MNASEGKNSSSSSSTPEQQSASSNLTLTLLKLSNKIEQEFATRPAEKIMVAGLILVSFYLSLTASLYQWKNTKDNMKVTNKLCLFSAYALFVQCAWFLISVQGRDLPETVCLVYSFMEILLSLTSKALVYVVLWMRQQGIYEIPTIKQSKVASAVSYGTLVAIVVLCLTEAVVINLVPTKSTSRGCESVRAPSTFHWALTALCLLFTLTQISLLALTLLPLYAYVREKAGNRSTIRKLIVRLCKCTSVCVATDVLFLGFAVTKKYLKISSPTLLTIVFAFNSAINVIALFASFADAKARLAAFKARDSEEHQVEIIMAEMS